MFSYFFILFIISHLSVSIFIKIYSTSDSTPQAEMGEVKREGRVKSNAELIEKSVENGKTTRLYPSRRNGVESRGRVKQSLREEILCLVAVSPRSKSEIAKALGRPRISGNIVRRIYTLLDDELIEPTIPDKPNSRLQQYRATKKGRQLAEILRTNHPSPPQA